MGPGHVKTLPEGRPAESAGGHALRGRSAGPLAPEGDRSSDHPQEVAAGEERHPALPLPPQVSHLDPRGARDAHFGNPGAAGGAPAAHAAGCQGEDPVAGVEGAAAAAGRLLGCAAGREVDGQGQRIEDIHSC